MFQYCQTCGKNFEVTQYSEILVNGKSFMLCADCRHQLKQIEQGKAFQTDEYFRGCRYFHSLPNYALIDNAIKQFVELPIIQQPTGVPFDESKYFFSTTNEIAGYRTVKHNGFIHIETVMPSLSVKEELYLEAQKVNANAVVGVSVFHFALVNSPQPYARIITGTAVTVQKHE